MCDPVSGAMAFMAVMQTQQQQVAAEKEARAINNAFEENNEMQNEAYNKDMEAYWDEEVAIQEQMFANAEDAADAKLDMQIQQKQDVSSMIAANAESTGGGQTPQALLGNLRRSQLNTARDLDEEYQRGVVALEGEIGGLQRDKAVRYNQAIGAINSAPRASYQSRESKLLALGMAGGSAYVQGQAMQGNNLFGSTTPTSPASPTMPQGPPGGGATSLGSGRDLQKGFTRRALASNSRQRVSGPGSMYEPIGTGRGVVNRGWTYKGTGKYKGMVSKGWDGSSYNYYKRTG